MSSSCQANIGLHIVLHAVEIYRSIFPRSRMNGCFKVTQASRCARLRCFPCSFLPLKLSYEAAHVN